MVISLSITEIIARTTESRRDEASSCDATFGVRPKVVSAKICLASGDTLFGSLALISSFYSVLLLLIQPTRPTPMPPKRIAPGAGIGS